MNKAMFWAVPLFVAIATATAYAGCGCGSARSRGPVMMGGCGSYSSFGGYGGFRGCGPAMMGGYGVVYQGPSVYYGCSSYETTTCPVPASPAASPTTAPVPAPALPAAPSLSLPATPETKTSTPIDTTPKPPVPQPLPAAPSMKPTTFQIRVPADAVVYVNGHQTTSTGEHRTYLTWAEVGKTYTYNFVVQTVHDGQVWEDRQSYLIQADRRYDLAFQPMPPKVLVVSNR